MEKHLIMLSVKHDIKNRAKPLKTFINKRPTIMLMYDLIIIGAGPAGLSAAVYAARRKIKFCIITENIGGQAAISHDVENYLGFSNITGRQLSDKFFAHLHEYNPEIKTEEEVIELRKEGDVIKLKTTKAEYDAICVIIAAGKHPRKLDCPGADDFNGRGIHYWSDENLEKYKNKNIAIIGGGNSALEDILHISGVANKIYVINNGPELTGEQIFIDRVLSNPKVEIHNCFSISKIEGTNWLESIEIENINDKNHKLTLAVSDIFVDIGWSPYFTFGGSLEKNSRGEIKIKRTDNLFDENMTNIPGIFAAGDITDVPLKQIAVAVGEGAKAAFAAFGYIVKMKHVKKE